MIYLHKSVFQSHGYLSSANCHVDSRWVLKISGFALHAFRKEDCREQVNKYFFVVTLELIVCKMLSCLTGRPLLSLLQPLYSLFIVFY